MKLFGSLIKMKKGKDKKAKERHPTESKERRRKKKRNERTPKSENFDEKTVMHEIPEKKHLDIGMSSIIGTREYQQDAAAYRINEENQMLAVLCDGMGGLEGGEGASSYCVSVMCEEFLTNFRREEVLPLSFLCEEIRKLDIKVSEFRTDDGTTLRAGTTLLGVYIEGNELNWVAVGDSRIYLIRGEEMVQITKDHNYKLILEEKVDAGEMSEIEAGLYPQKEALISYIGMGGIAKINLNDKPFAMADGDCVLMCSDGLYKVLDDATICRTVSLYRDNMTEAAEILTALAAHMATGSQDNTTVIIMRYIG